MPRRRSTRAFTSGRDVSVAKGELSDHREGNRLVAHEAVHAAVFAGCPGRLAPVDLARHVGEELDGFSQRRAALGADAPTVTYAGAWFDHPLFIETMAVRTRDALAEAPEAPLVFTAHSIPVPMAGESPYVRELETSARLTAAAVGRDQFTLAYQSRSGGPRDPWLEPDVNDVIRECAARGERAVVVVPIGFVCDHVEVRYDLDIEARATAESVGVRLIRAETANDHPTFARMLAAVVRAAVGS